MKKLDKILLAITAAVLIVGIACGARLFYVYSSPPRITLVNNSASTLLDVVLEGRGFSEKIQALPAHSSRTVYVHPRGESGLKITFKVGSEQFEKDGLAYIESKGGYFAIVTVDESFGVSTQSGLRR